MAASALFVGIIWQSPRIPAFEPQPVINNNVLSSETIYNENCLIMQSAFYCYGSQKEKERILDYIGLKSEELNLPFKKIVAIAKCESGLNPSAIGDSGKSIGLFQIHLPAHPDITKEQAYDWKWATNWSLNEMKKGNWDLWSCNKIVF